MKISVLVPRLYSNKIYTLLSVYHRKEGNIFAGFFLRDMAYLRVFSYFIIF